MFRVFFIVAPYCEIQYRFRAGGACFSKRVTENHKTMRGVQCAI